MSIEPKAITPWIDSHCHFDFQQFDHDREQHWQFLTRMGCVGLVIPGVTANTWSTLIGGCSNKPWAYALGLHPYFIDQHEADDLLRLSIACETHHPIAIGEFGLDFVLPEETFTRQIELCQQQFQLAKTLELPVILHVRKAYDEIAAMVRRIGFKQGGIIHAFSGSLQQGEALIKLGFKLGIGGAISHRRALKLRKTVANLPLDALVLETDSPDMKPAFLAGQRNSPVSLLLLSQMVASLKDCHGDKVILASNHNLYAVMPRLKAII